jgi:putative ABC transport system permease protein
MILTVALRNLLRAKKRTVLLGVAIAIVAMLFSVLRSVSSSVSKRMIESATTLSAGHVNVGGFSKLRKKGADAVLHGRKELRALITELVPDAQKIIDRSRGWGRVISSASSLNAGLSGIDPSDEQRFFKSLRYAKPSEYGSSESKIGNFEDLSLPNRALIFAAQAKKLEVGVGDFITIVIEGNGGQSNTVDLTVAAVASDIGFMSNWNVFMNRNTIIDLYKFDQNTTGAFMIYLNDPSQASSVRKKLEVELPKKGYEVMSHDPNPFFMKFDKVMGESWLGQKLDLTIWSDEISFVMWITTALDFVSFLVIGVLAVIITGGILNSMWMAVRERTKEVGTMRAIGASRSFVVRLFLYESVLLGVFASALGTAVAYFILNVPIKNDGVRLFLMTNEFKFVLSSGQFLLSVVLFALLAGFAALFPALRAARMSPVEALMHSKGS